VMRDEFEANGRLVHKWRLIRPSASKPWELYDIQADMLERTNLLRQVEEGPIQQINRSLQAAYEVWWREVSAQASDYCRPIAGSPAEPVLCLYSHDWHMNSGLPPWNQTMITAGMKANGFNAVAFDRAGDYTFDLRRWPREIGGETTLASQLRCPIRVTVSNALTHGQALPIHSARIRIWNGDQTYADKRQAVNPDSSGPAFTLQLPAGPAMVQTWFYDDSGHELCGAYYVYVSLATK